MSFMFVVDFDSQPLLLLAHLG